MRSHCSASVVSWDCFNVLAMCTCEKNFTAQAENLLRLLQISFSNPNGNCCSHAISNTEKSKSLFFISHAISFALSLARSFSLSLFLALNIKTDWVKHRFSFYSNPFRLVAGHDRKFLLINWNYPRNNDFIFIWFKEAFYEHFILKCAH